MAQIRIGANSLIVADAEHFLRVDAVFSLTPRRSCHHERALFIVGEAFNQRREFSLAMDHGRDEHSLVTYAVDDAIAVDQEFADGVVIELGHGTTSAREALELASRGQDLLHHGPRIDRRVTFDVFGDGFDVIERVAAQLAPV